MCGSLLLQRFRSLVMYYCVLQSPPPPPPHTQHPPVQLSGQLGSKQVDERLLLLRAQPYL